MCKLYLVSPNDFLRMTAVPLVRSRSLIEILWADSVAPGARPVFPASSLFSLLASVNMAAQLNSARHTPQCTALLLIRLRRRKQKIS